MIRGLVYLLYGLIILLLVRMVGRWLAVVFGPGGEVRRTGRPPARKVEDLVRDPVCNTYVPRSRALTAVVGGHAEHFCSEACRDRARAAAARAS